jgi:hypothetical protein
MVRQKNKAPSPTRDEDILRGTTLIFAPEQTLFCNITVTPVATYCDSAAPLTSELQESFVDMLSAGAHLSVDILILYSLGQCVWRDYNTLGYIFQWFLL